MMMSLQEFTAEIGRRLGLALICYAMPNERVQIDLAGDPACVYTCDRTPAALVKAESDLAMRAKELEIVTVH